MRCTLYNAAGSNRPVQRGNINRRATTAPRPAGFTLVELLLALVITAVLLTAVALAFQASIMNYRENEDIFKAVNSARQALFRITAQLRTATAVDPNTPSNECTFITADGQNITYRYSDADRTLYLITNDDTADDDYALCTNVDALRFTRNVVTDDGITKVRSVQIAITVSSGDLSRTIAAAAVVRRNLD